MKPRSLIFLFCCALIPAMIAHCGPGAPERETCVAPTGDPEGSETKSPPADYHLQAASVRYDADLDLLVFEQTVAGAAGGTVPTPAGQLNGAPVEGYVFPTDLKGGDVGFDDREGIVALAVTAHPDFDDTPLWDENNDRDYKNDGPVFHSHWVLLGPDERVPGGLAVQAVDATSVLPPTNPGMPMYMDSPGFSIVRDGSHIRVLVPAQRVNHRKDFQYDAVTAFMRVSIGDPDKPMLGVYAVHSVCSGDLSLPFRTAH
ncbi:MAG: hypothetical protein NXI24_11880 [bacterium]|nr:hypothetical protein [bacterium]